VKSFQVNAIGRVESTLTDLGAAPRQPDEGAPAAWLHFEPAVREALADLHQGDEVLLFTWLDRASRDVLRVHPRGDPSRPKEMDMSQAISLVVYSVKDLAKAKALYGGGRLIATVKDPDGNIIGLMQTQ
jgi:hypothetical protein